MFLKPIEDRNNFLAGLEFCCVTVSIIYRFAQW